jgi:hypothetical protein
MTEIMVNIMAEVLLILAITTKEVKRGRMSESIPTVELAPTYSSSERFFQRLSGRSDIEDALRRLDTLTQEEHRMATTQDLRVTHRVDDRVQGVDERIKSVDERVQGVDEKVQGIDDRMQGADDKTDVLIDSALPLFASDSPLTGFAARYCAS